MNNSNKNTFNCIGYAFVPVQCLNKVYSAEDALCNASLFPELVMDMREYGRVCREGGCCD